MYVGHLRRPDEGVGPLELESHTGEREAPDTRVMWELETRSSGPLEEQQVLSTMKPSLCLAFSF